MSDDGYCGDTGGDCSYDTGGGCDYTGGGCDDSGPCIEATSYMETTFSDNAGIHIGQPYETYDRDYCYGETYGPVYSNLSTNNNYKMNSSERTFFIIACTVILILCKLKFLRVRLDIYN